MTKQYLVPFNFKMFDPIKAYSRLSEIDWTLNSKTIKIDINSDESIDDNAFYTTENKSSSNPNKPKTRVKLMYQYDDDKSNALSFNKLRENGLKGNIQRAQMLDKNKELCDYINSIDDI